MLISSQQIIEFLQDELLIPIKIIKDGLYEFQIQINEPTIWGTNDSKFRCGIIAKIIKNSLYDNTIQQSILFNAFKARAILGEEYHGSFFQFVKLVKNFDTINEAKQYFLTKYASLNNFNDNINVLNNNNIIFNDNKNNKIITFPEHFKKLDITNNNIYLQYLLQRGVNYKRLKQLKIFFNDIEKRIVFPVYENNKLIFYIERDITGINPIRWKKSKGENIYPIWNLENISGNVVYIFEGIFDAINLPNGVALLGVGAEQHFLKILQKKFQKIILIFDNDEAGRNARYKWAKWLNSKNFNNIYIFNYNDINEKDFSELYQNQNINYDFIKSRIIPWNDKTEVQFKLNLIK